MAKHRRPARMPWRLGRAHEGDRSEAQARAKSWADGQFWGDLWGGSVDFFEEATERDFPPPPSAVGRPHSTTEGVGCELRDFFAVDSSCELPALFPLLAMNTVAD
jgi:hypothetical protein